MTADSPWRLLDVEPGPLDGPHGWMFHAVADLDRAVLLDETGNTDDAQPAASYQWELTPQGPDDKRWVAKRWVLAVDAAAADAAAGDAAGPDADLRHAVVGRASVHMHVEQFLDQAWMRLAVHPEHRRQGLGAVLLAWAESVAADAGRTVLQTGAGFGPDSGDLPRITPTHGRGTVPDSPGVRFGLAHGYAIEQVARRSILPLPVDPALLARLADDAREHADGYRVHVWHGPVPDEFLEPYALLETRMSTDTPAGGMAREEDVWDGERVRREEANLRSNGFDWVIASAEHVATGELVGTTRLVWPPLDRAECAYQWDTIVLSAHRGHRLGMLLKAANLGELARLRPATTRIHTGNAEENDHMLAINVALGFAPAGGGVDLQKVTGEARSDHRE